MQGSCQIHTDSIFNWIGKMRGVKPSNFRKSASNVFLQKVLYLLQLRCFRRKNLPPRSYARFITLVSPKPLAIYP
jgi:hypothetical protein